VFQTTTEQYSVPLKLGEVAPPTLIFRFVYDWAAFIEGDAQHNWVTYDMQKM